MTAGTPNWNKLHAMGKLPPEARNKIPMLAQLDAANARIKELEAEIAKLKGEDKPSDVEGNTFTAQCGINGCEFVGKGKSDAVARNMVKLHSRTHAAAENKVEGVANAAAETKE